MYFNDGVTFEGGVYITSVLVDGVASPLSANLVYEESLTVSNFTPMIATEGTGTPPYSYVISSGTLPAGLTLNSVTGVVSGTTTTAQSSTPVTFAVQDFYIFQSATKKTFNITVLPRITATAVTTPLRAEVSRTITAIQPLIAANGNGVYTYSITPALPAGLSMNTSTGIITGTPSAVSAQTAYTVSVVDSLGVSATTTSTFNITVFSLITAVATNTARTFNEGEAITPFQPLVATGGTGVYTYLLASGSVLPTGITLNPTTGFISGTTNQTNYGTVTVTVLVRDDLNVTAATTATFSIYVYVYITAIAGATTSITSTVGVAITSFTPLTPVNGNPPYTYYFSGTLPAGLTYTNGIVSGTPTSAITGPVTFFVKDSFNNTASTSRLVNFTINAVTTAVASVITQTLEVTIPMTTYQPLTASGGTLPYTYYVSAGTLPAGLSLNASTGSITGTPTVAYGPLNVTISVRDSLNSVAATTATTSFRVFNLITATASATTTQVLEVGLASTSFTPLTAANGSGVYTYSSSVNLAAYGLTLNTSTGAVTGTPTVSSGGPLSVTFSVRDSLNVQAATTATVSYTIHPQITATADTTARSFQTQTTITPFTPLVAAGGTGVYTYYLSLGSLPTGLTLNSTTGAISGTTSNSPFNTTIRVSVRDSLNAVAATTAQFSLAVVGGNVTLGYMVVGGGGGGASAGAVYGSGGGGGGGAVVFGSFTQVQGTVLTITIGAGGGGYAYTSTPTYAPGRGLNGSSSSLTGVGFAPGGGGGGGVIAPAFPGAGTTQPGAPGGSGGGGAGYTPGGQPGRPGGAATHQGNGGTGTGGPSTPGNAGGGGGGGAPGNPNGDGGIGFDMIPLFGSGGPMIRVAAGGAGGFNNYGGRVAQGGAGGGGSLDVSGYGGAGVVNTGSGAAGMSGFISPGYLNAANGGSGVVVLSVPATSYSGVQTGNYQTWLNGGQRCLIWYSSGTYTV